MRSLTWGRIGDECFFVKCLGGCLGGVKGEGGRSLRQAFLTSAVSCLPIIGYTELFHAEGFGPVANVMCRLRNRRGEKDKYAESLLHR